MIKDLNRNEVKAGEVFHFQNSLEPFVYVDYPDCDFEMMFFNINSNRLYSFVDLDILGLKFYSKDDDEDFLGVEVDGKIKLEWVEEEDV